MSYASVQAIREGAGLLSRSENETLSGVSDNTNRIFNVARRPIVDGNYDEQVTDEDVFVYVGGSSVDIEDIDAEKGIITLAAAPPAGSRVTASYRFSPISDTYVRGKQDVADSWVNTKLRSAELNNPPKLPLSPVPGIISTAAELYASGLILTRDWGGRADTEQTSKDGFAKIRQARDIIDDFIAGLQADEKNAASANGNSRSISGVSDGDVFERRMPDDGCSPDDFFWRRRC